MEIFTVAKKRFEVKNCCLKQVDMMPGGSYHPPQPEAAVKPGSQGDGGGATQLRNPLMCFMCDDYYLEPCLLSCYHSFCARCLRGRENDGKIPCPLCGLETVLKEGTRLPPPDFLMRQLIVLANSENPPCANCDKRDKSAMYFCSTCGQSLCKGCRDNTHSAKMFSTHDVVHVSKCSKEVHRRCAVHGEQYIMFSTSQKTMLCVNCFRDTPADARLHCVDIDTAYTQDSKKLDRAVGSVRELQGSVRDGLLLFKSLLDELRRNMDLEKLTINNFCQGMQEAIAKTHSSMIMEVQRQFETKERQFRNQVMSLGTVLPLLQLHLNLCSSFLSSADKYQFLDMVYPMMDRLAAVSQLSHPIRPVQSSQIRTNYRNEFSHALEPWVGGGSTAQQPPPLAANTSDIPMGHQPSHHQPSRRQQSQLRAKALEGEGPFSNHCRSFDTQLKELGQQLFSVKERLSELHRDVRRAHTPPLSTRHEFITRECGQLEEQLECHQIELERLKNIFDTLWEEQLCRIHVEQEIFQSQMNDILTLRSEVKHLSVVAHQLEPYVKSLSGGSGGGGGGRDSNPRDQPQAQSQAETREPTPSGDIVSQHQLQTLLDHLAFLQLDSQHANYRMEAGQKGECRIHPSQLTSPSSDNVVYMKVESKEAPVRDTGSRGRSPHSMTNIMDSVYAASSSRGQQQQDPKKGVLSHLIEKVRTKEDRKKSPVREELRCARGGGKGDVTASGHRSKTPPCATLQPSDETKPLASSMKGSSAARAAKAEASRYGTGSGRESSSKVASLYHSISGKVLCSRDNASEDAGGPHLPPPPPPASMSQRASQVGCVDVRERLETHLKDKLAIAKHRKRQNSMGDQVELTSPGEGGTRQAVRALIHREQGNTAASTPTSPQRRRTHGDLIRMYPASDTEDSVFYSEEAGHHHSQRGYTTEKSMSDKARKQSSCESLTLSTVSVNSRRSSVDLGLGDRKTFVVVIGTKNAKARLMQKQRSWETFPPKRRDEGYRESDSFRGGFDMRGTSEPGEGMGLRMDGLKKADSFEGHEEAVRTLVAAVQETRSQIQHQQRKQSQSKPSGN